MSTLLFWLARRVILLTLAATGAFGTLVVYKSIGRADIADGSNVEVKLTDSQLPPPNFESCPDTPIYPVSTKVTDSFQ